MNAQLEDVLGQMIRERFASESELASLAARAGDASSRRYYRAVLRSAAAPPSVIVMQLPRESALPLSSEELAVFKEPPKELPFINVHRFLRDTGVRVPELYGYWASEVIIVLAD